MTAIPGALKAAHMAQAALGGVSVDYIQDGTRKTITGVVPGSSEHEIEDVSGIVLESHLNRDFLILVADFPFDVPLRGDVIEFDGKRFEVLPPRNVGRHYQPSDQWGVRYRIHTKYVENVSQ